MQKLRKKNKRVKPLFKSQKLQVVATIKNHPAWRDELSLENVHMLLKGKGAFTYVLSQGIDQEHYFLSYVNPEGLVKCKNIRLLFTNGGWSPGNGAGGGIGGFGTRYDSIVDLIPACLKVSKEVCKPL